MVEHGTHTPQWMEQRLQHIRWIFDAARADATAGRELNPGQQGNIAEVGVENLALKLRLQKINARDAKNGYSGWINTCETQYPDGRRHLLGMIKDGSPITPKPSTRVIDSFML